MKKLTPTQYEAMRFWRGDFGLSPDRLATPQQAELGLELETLKLLARQEYVLDGNRWWNYVITALGLMAILCFEMSTPDADEKNETPSHKRIP